MAKTTAITIPRGYVKMIKTKRRRRSKTTIPLAVIAGFVPLGLYMWEGYQNAGPTQAARYGILALTGYDTYYKSWNPTNLKVGMMPIIIGFGIHWLAGKIGINRALGRAKVPFIRI